MSAVSSIEWTDRTWNPVRGCSRVSPGCDNCYAMRQAHRFNTQHPDSPYHGLTVLRPKTAKRPGVDWSGVVRFVPEMLDAPLRWRAPRRIFVNSMSDLFHEGLTNEEIAAVFGVMAACPQHTFQVLTKRPKRAAEWFAWVDAEYASNSMPWKETRLVELAEQHGANLCIEEEPRHGRGWPLPNVWMGVSAENQATADERIPLLLELPAAVRFISAEPLLGPLDLNSWPAGQWLRAIGRDGSAERPGLDWVIVGGESGNGARHFGLPWARSIVEQCRAAGVACFVKQLGALASDYTPGRPEDQYLMQLVNRKGGDPAEWPPELRVREFPAVRL